MSLFNRKPEKQPVLPEPEIPSFWDLLNQYGSSYAVWDAYIRGELKTISPKDFRERYWSTQGDIAYWLQRLCIQLEQNNRKEK